MLLAKELAILEPRTEAGPTKVSPAGCQHDVHMALALARDLRTRWGSPLRDPMVPQHSILWG